LLKFKNYGGVSLKAKDLVLVEHFCNL